MARNSLEPGVGRRVAEARRAAGLNQTEVAGAVGLHRTAVSKIESGRRGVDSVELGRLAELLGRPVEWFLAAPGRTLSRDRLFEAGRKEVLRLARKHGATNVRVFGSVARGEAAAGSDVDLLVEMRPGRTLLDQAALMLDLEALLGCEVDVVTERGLRGRVRDRALADAEPL